jgi:hypothetical protein
MPEYRCELHGIVAARDVEGPDSPDHCPACGGQIWKSAGESGPDAEAVRVSRVSGPSHAA